MELGAGLGKRVPRLSVTLALPSIALAAAPAPRLRIEGSFQATTTLTGLDEHQVRRWTSWRRWILIAMLAHVLIALTCNEITRLINRLIVEPIRFPTRVLRWSHCRLRDQRRAQASHYRRRRAT